MNRQSEQDLTIHDLETCELPLCAQTNDHAPLFTAEAYHPSQDHIKTINLRDYRGKWVVLLFYASDFTFV